MSLKPKHSLLLIVLALLLAACGGGGKKADAPSGGDGGAPATSTAPAPAAPADDGPYTVSGVIVDPDGTPLPGVQVMFSPFVGIVTTDTEGYWSLDNVTRSSLTVIPDHSDYQFDEEGYEVGRGDEPLRIVATPIGCPELSPCKIADVDDLQNMRDDVTGHYVLVGPIDASGTRNWNDGAGFEPIGAQRERFTGRFDGNGFEISGLYINRPNEQHVALFRYVGTEGEIRNVGLVDGETVGGSFTASLVAWSEGTVANAYNTGSVSGSGDRVGGLVSRNHEGGLITDSYNRGPVRAADGTVGGLVAESWGGRVSHSYNEGAVTSDFGYAGGLISTTDGDSVVEHSYNTGTVEGTETIGGLVAGNRGLLRHSYNEGTVVGQFGRVGGVAGLNHQGTIEHSSNRGDVTGGTDVGGITGSNGVAGVVAYSYNTGAVTATEANAGGIAGENADSFFGESFNAVRFVYNFGPVQSRHGAGGIVGRQSSAAIIEQAYSTGSVQVLEGHWDVPDAGGLIGEWRTDRQAPDAGSITAAFYVDDYFAGGPGAVNTMDFGTAASREQLTDESFFIEAGWDFDGVWTMGEDGYPELVDNRRP